MALQVPTDLDFLSANLHGCRSRMAEAERLDQLCRLRSVAELARVLYPEGGFLTASHLQRVLVLEQVEELSAIAAKVRGPAGRLLDWLRVRFQMEDLKVLARGFAQGMGLKELQPHLVPLPDDLALDVKALASAGSIEAFAAACPTGPLREGMRRAADLYNRKPRPFFVEAGMDHGYLAELLARSRALPRGQRGGVLEIARQEADTFHLVLAARGRFHYALGPEMLAPFHVPGARLDRDRFARLLAAEDLGAVAAAVTGLAIDGLPTGPDRPAGEPDPALLETLAWERYWRLANRTFRLSHMGLGAVVAYTAIRRVELANLIRLSEGIRSGLSPEAIRCRLIPRPGLVPARAAPGEAARV
jgi:vacuolar-type H+-ATPase subunit C/Vma6